MDELNELLSKAGCAIQPSAADDGVAPTTTENRLSQYRELRGHAHSDFDQSQQRRRDQLLRAQKQRRDSQLSKFRDLCEVDGESADLQSMETAPSTFSYRKRAGRGSRFAARLMLSEWMFGAAPSDLSSDWLLKLCPSGRRCLVMTGRDKFTGKACTFSFSVGGMLLRSFPSLLPSGCHRGNDSGNHGSSRRVTLLDCLFEQSANTFHVLDIVSWNGHPVDECETEFRFVWLTSKLSEQPGIDHISRHNPFRFVPLSFHVCGPPDRLLQTLCSQAAHEADGLLFFHRHGHYTSGSTPLVLWLKPFMVAETLPTAAPSSANPGDQQLPPVPPDYPGKQRYIELFELERRERRPRSSHSAAMET